MNIVANIVTMIIAWLYKRGTLGAKNLLTKGVVQARLRRIFSTRVIPILIDSLSILLNLGLLIFTFTQQSSFTRLEVISPMVSSGAIVFWVYRLVSDIQKERYIRTLATFDLRHGELQESLGEVRQQAAEMRRILSKILKLHKPRPRSSKEDDSQKDLFP